MGGDAGDAGRVGEDKTVSRAGRVLVRRGAGIMRGAIRGGREEQERELLTGFGKV